MSSSWIVQGIIVAYSSLGVVLLLSTCTAIILSLIAMSYDIAFNSHLTAQKFDWISAAKENGKRFFHILVIGLIGGLAGHLGGGSREGVVGDLVPAVFALFGGYVAYFVGEKNDINRRIVVNTIAFLLCFFSLYNVSSVWRQSNENWEFCRRIYSDPNFNTAQQWDGRNLIWGVFCQSVFADWTTVPVMPRDASKSPSQP